VLVPLNVRGSMEGSERCIAKPIVLRPILARCLEVRTAVRRSSVGPRLRREEGSPFRCTKVTTYGVDTERIAAECALLVFRKAALVGAPPMLGCIS
jgi:hypothetical protein